jgi:Family of unknown function (DUF6304)
MQAEGGHLMFSEAYPAVYRDRFGEVATTLYNDGKQLRMTLRGVKFTGRSLDDWDPGAHADVTLLQSFTFMRSGRELCEYTLEFDMPIQMVFQAEQLQGTLHVLLTLGAATPNGGTDREILFLRLTVGDSSFASQGKVGWFEDELLDIQRQLPEGMYMQICFCCAYSDYHPVGNGLFGDLACFRNKKREYLAIRNKYALMDMWPTHIGDVQETYRCPEFERRKLGTGYRG